MAQPSLVILRVLRLIVGFILLQTLFFKFTGAPESIHLFTELSKALVGHSELEKVLRLGTGSLELLTGILLFLPKTSFLGALLAAGTMGGALLAHVTVLGIDTGDGGLLFSLACLTFFASHAIMALLWKTQRRKCWPF